MWGTWSITSAAFMAALAAMLLSGINCARADDECAAFWQRYPQANDHDAWSVCHGRHPNLGAPGGGGQQGGGSSDCSDPTLSPPERQICTDDDIFNETIWSAAETGFVGSMTQNIPNIIGCAFGGQFGNCAKVIIPNVIIPTVVTTIDGYVVAKKQEADRQKIRAIDAATADVRKENARLQQSVDAARAMVDASTNNLDQIDEQVKSGQMTLEQAQAEREHILRNKQYLDRLITGLVNRRSEYQQAAGQMNQPSQDFDEQMREMNSQIDQLKQQLAVLNQALAVRNINS